MEPKILLYDIETMANLAWVWGKYEQDVIEYDREWHMLSWSAKWLGGKSVTKGLIDYPKYKKDKTDDTELVKDLWNLFNEADIIIAHNGDSFDIKKTNTRFIELGLSPPHNYRTIDTKKVAKKYFGFNSNKLDDLGRRLGVGRKIKTEGFELWLGCMHGDPRSWNLMKKYNKQDVILLEKVYLKMRPWMTNHPNLAVILGEGCPNCGGTLGKQGTRYSQSVKRQQYKCKDCGAWTSGEIIKL